MQWFWMNIPLGAMIFAIWTGVPLWLVLRHPDRGPGSSVPATSRQAHAAAPVQPQAADIHSPKHAGESRPLVGAGR
jgi:hypothetical protein